MVTWGSAQMTHLFLLLRAATYEGRYGPFLWRRLGSYHCFKGPFSSICAKRRCDVVLESRVWILGCFPGRSDSSPSVGRGRAGLLRLWSPQLLMLTEGLASRDSPGLAGPAEVVPRICSEASRWVRAHTGHGRHKVRREARPQPEIFKVLPAGLCSLPPRWPAWVCR